MARGNPVAAELVPPALAGVDLAHYRLLLPLRHEERDVYRPWSAFFPGGMDARDQLRSSDLEDLRHRALEAGQDMTGWDTCRGAVSGDFVHTLREALGGCAPSGHVDTGPLAGLSARPGGCDTGDPEGSGLRSAGPGP